MQPCWVPGSVAGAKRRRIHVHWEAHSSSPLACSSARSRLVGFRKKNLYFIPTKNCITNFGRSPGTKGFLLQGEHLINLCPVKECLPVFPESLDPHAYMAARLVYLRRPEHTLGHLTVLSRSPHSPPSTYLRLTWTHAQCSSESFAMRSSNSFPLRVELLFSSLFVHGNLLIGILATLSHLVNLSYWTAGSLRARMPYTLFLSFITPRGQVLC